MIAPEAARRPVRRSSRVARDRSPEERIVRFARALARRLHREKRKAEQLLAQARELRAAGSGGAVAPVGLAAALPHIERALRQAVLEIDQAWSDLDASFLRRDLAEAVRRASRVGTRDDGRT